MKAILAGVLSKMLEEILEAYFEQLRNACPTGWLL